MNTKQKLTKWTSIMLLVAIASLATAGLALADHEIPVGSVERSSRTAFDQYNAVLAHMEENLNAALFASFNTRNNSAVRFDQYTMAIEQMIRSSEAAFATLTTRQSDDSLFRWEQYLEYAQ